MSNSSVYFDAPDLPAIVDSQETPSAEGHRESVGGGSVDPVESATPVSGLIFISFLPRF